MRTFHRHRGEIIAFLSFLAIGLLLYSGATYIAEQIVDGADTTSDQVVDRLLAVSSLIRDLTIAVATITAGVWTYYVFVRGRTLKPRMSLDISLVAIVHSTSLVAVIRIKATNHGQVQIRPTDLVVEFCAGVRRSKRVSFRRFDKIKNVLSMTYGPKYRFHLEPNDTITFDVTTFLKPPSPRDEKVAISELILVDVLLVDINRRAWNEKRLLVLGSHGDYND